LLDFVVTCQGAQQQLGGSGDAAGGVGRGVRGAGESFCPEKGTKRSCGLARGMPLASPRPTAGARSRAV